MHQSLCLIYRKDVLSKIKKFDWNFDDYNDPALKEMFDAAKRYVFDISMNLLIPHEHPPYWLTFLGASEAGKTHLAHAINRYFRKHIENSFVPVKGCTDKQLVTKSSCFVVSSEFGKSSIKNHEEIYILNETHMIVVDELDPKVSPIEKDQVCKLLSWRAGAGTSPFKWTVLTANLTREQIGNEFDVRLASRLRRESNVIVDLPDNITAYLDR